MIHGCKGSNFRAMLQCGKTETLTIFLFFFEKTQKSLYVQEKSVYLQKNSMPKIFEYFGFIFYFFSNEHEPIHVHVKHSGTECVFDLIIESGKLKDIVRREKKGAKPLDSQDEKVAIEFINKYWQRIVRKWIDFFVMKKVVKTTHIKERI